MAKRKASSKCTIFLALLVVCAVGLIATMFLNGVVYKTDNSETFFKGMEIAFGKTTFDSEAAFGGILSYLGQGKNKLDFSFLMVLGLFLPLVGAIVAAVMGKKRRFIMGVICACVFVFSAVMMFIAPQITSITTEITTLVGNSTTTTKLVDADYTLAIGTIIGGVVSVLGAFCSLGYAVIK